MLDISVSFYPIRIIAYTRNEVELKVNVKNESSQPLWVEIEVNLPNDLLSLHPTSFLRNGRIRGGIIFGNEEKTVRCKIYANSAIYPDLYKINVVGYAYDKDGVIAKRCEKIAELRCDRVR
ncbi:MAG: hypothetical protein QXI58_03685 [Candidatus Micrarchaeia archaeon]